MDPEQSEADVVEQRLAPDDDGDRVPAEMDTFTDPDGFPTEADPADVAEQHAIVPQDIDEP